jgi:hypothetical protein
MESLTPALHGALATARPSSAAAGVLLVIGGGGVLGSALLARALACGGFARVEAVVAKELSSTLRGFEPLPAASLQVGGLQATCAAIVFERVRNSNGRDDAFFQPEAAALPALAAALHAGGVRRLLVVVPHAPALLPQALKAGLASLDEAGVAALGFEQLVFLRTAQAGGGAPSAGTRWQRWGAGFAAWWLSQLRWMVPASEQPVRAVRVAELAVELALRLPGAPPGTRVLPPELLWQAARSTDAGELLGAWLDGARLPETDLPAQRW